MIGIYKIITKHNKKIYIGSSDNIDKRFKSHLSRLKRNVHHSPYLQAVYNKYGISNLEFTILEILENNYNKIEREQYWMDFYKSYDKNYGYNVSRIANCNVTGEKKTYQYSLEGNFIKEWNSRREAEETLKISNIKTTINDKNRNYSGNYQWKNFKKDKIKSVLVIYCAYDKNGNFVKEFKTITEVKEFYKMNSFPNLNRAIKENKTCCNYFWRKYDTYKYPLFIETSKPKTKAKKVLQLDLNYKVINTYNSLSDAAKAMNLHASNLHRAVNSNNSKYKTCRGFIWQYL